MGFKFVTQHSVIKDANQRKYNKMTLTLTGIENQITKSEQIAAYFSLP